MYVGFQEQQHVEMLKYSEGAKAQYALQAAQLDTTLEQMKMTGMENLANWILETPSFTMDMTPLMTMIADLKTTEETTALARAELPLRTREAGIKKGISVGGGMYEYPTYETEEWPGQFAGIAKPS